MTEKKEARRDDRREGYKSGSGRDEHICQCVCFRECTCAKVQHWKMPLCLEWRRVREILVDWGKEWVRTGGGDGKDDTKRIIEDDDGGLVLVMKNDMEGKKNSRVL